MLPVHRTVLELPQGLKARRSFFWLIRGKRAHDMVEEIRTVL